MKNGNEGQDPFSGKPKVALIQACGSLCGLRIGLGGIQQRRDSICLTDYINWKKEQGIPMLSSSPLHRNRIGTGFRLCLLGAIAVFSMETFGMSYMPSPEFYPELKDSDSLPKYDSSGRINSYRKKRIYRYQLDSSIADEEYRYSEIKLIYGAGREESIVRFNDDGMVTKNGEYKFKDISGLTNFYGPRFSKTEKRLLVVEPLLLAALFSGFELIRYSQTKEFRWQMPVIPFGIMFGIIFPFTLDFESQSMVVK